jgi:hypothetical protein
MSYRPHYVSGDWKAICDVCGRTFKASQIRKRWDGLMVCSSDFETRHPQDFVRGVVDTQVVPWNRTQSTDDFSNAPFCTIVSIQCVAGLGTAGCAIVGRPLTYT